jgi:hypothetical protein
LFAWLQGKPSLAAATRPHIVRSGNRTGPARADRIAQAMVGRVLFARLGWH